MICEKEFCSNTEIIASQLGAKILTTESLLGDFTFNSSLKGLNSTFFDDLEYKTFCDNNPDLDCLTDFSAVSFFNASFLGNFTIVNLIYENKDKI